MARESWKIDNAHSSIHFKVRHMVFAKVRGHFSSWNATLELDPDRPETAQIAAEIDAASIDTREPDRDKHLRSADFLDVEGHPTITFKSKRVDKTGDKHYRVAGDSTIHGVTHEAVLDTEETGRGKDPWGNQRVGYAATTSINRTDYGLKWNQVLETGGVLVGERVDIEIELETIRPA